MKNKLAYLGFLGFFSLLAPLDMFRENMSAAFSMIGFFVFFHYAKVVPDELFIQHVQKSASRAFFVGLIFSAPALMFSFSMDSTILIRYLFITAISVSLVTFVISLEIFERKEKKELEDDFAN